MNITNIKFHVRIKDCLLGQYQWALQHADICICKKTSSFITFKYRSFTYTCFNSGFVNVTGVKRRKEKSVAVKALEECLSLEHKSFTRPIVDNISSNWSEKNKLKKINLLVILSIAQKHNSIKETKYNREKFPALFLKTCHWGTLLWYGSPAIVAVGSKSKKDVKLLNKVIQSILNDVDLL